MRDRMIEKKLSLKSANGMSQLNGILYLPEHLPKGLIQISHGMVEHIGRYKAFMIWLVEQGYGVCGHDHIGHGKSFNPDTEKTFGYFAKKHGDDYLVEDLYAFGQLAKQEAGSVPHILLGHSMGSFIARLCVVKYPEAYNGFIMSGTGGPSLMSQMGSSIMGVMKPLLGPEKQSEKLDQLLFGGFNKGIINRKTHKDWLTRDADIVESYLQDPYCQFLFTTSALKDLGLLTKKANQTDWFSKVSKTMPILMISGKEDPVGDYGKGVTKVYEKLKSNGCQVEYILYEGGRHEMLNETNRQEVYCDILKWLDEANF